MSTNSSWRKMYKVAPTLCFDVSIVRFLLCCIFRDNLMSRLENTHKVVYLCVWSTDAIEILVDYFWHLVLRISHSYCFYWDFVHFDHKSQCYIADYMLHFDECIRRWYMQILMVYILVMTELRRDRCTFNYHEDIMNYILTIFVKYHNLYFTTIEQKQKWKYKCKTKNIIQKITQPKATRQAVWMVWLTV